MFQSGFLCHSHEKIPERVIGFARPACLWAQLHRTDDKLDVTRIRVITPLSTANPYSVGGFRFLVLI